MNNFFLIFFIIVFGSINFAQNCTSPEARQYDFWIGEWKAEWTNADGTKSEGSNKINSILDGCVIEENFNGSPGIDLIGKSFSVYNERQGKWQQTWVDNNGGYLDFTGEYKDDKMILTRKGKTREGKDALFRMVFYNIEEKSFDWDWEISQSEDDEWKTLWSIHYTRKN